MDKTKWNIPNLRSAHTDVERSPDDLIPTSPQPAIEIEGLELETLAPDVVREIRKACGMTQAELAKWCGVSVRAVKAWEHRGDSGESRPCEKTARKCLVLLAHDPGLARIY
jgi:DNA-binding transcriptional regulator YiaG